MIFFHRSIKFVSPPTLEFIFRPTVTTAFSGQHTMAPKKSKRNVSDDDSSSDSGPIDRNPPPKKTKTSDKGSSNKNEEEHSWLLERNRFVKVRDFRGKLMVDIREFYEKNGELLPGKKGISLSMSQWNKLKEHMDDIEASIEKLG